MTQRTKIKESGYLGLTWDHSPFWVIAWLGSLLPYRQSTVGRIQDFGKEGGGGASNC